MFEGTVNRYWTVCGATLLDLKTMGEAGDILISCLLRSESSVTQGISRRRIWNATGSLNFAMKCEKWESIDKTWQDLHLLFWGEDLYCHELSEDRVYKCIHVHTMICAKPPSLNKHQTAAQCALDSWSQDESGIEVLAAVFPPCFKDGQRCHAGNVLPRLRVGTVHLFQPL